MTRDEKIDIYNEVDNFVEENEGEVTHTEIARHFFELGRNNAINNACDWIEEFMQMTPSKKTFIKRFKQAMKGD